jgi:hypothetical protein
VRAGRGDREFGVTDAHQNLISRLNPADIFLFDFNHSHIARTNTAAVYQQRINSFRDVITIRCHAFSSIVSPMVSSTLSSALSSTLTPASPSPLELFRSKLSVFKGISSWRTRGTRSLWMSVDGVLKAISEPVKSPKPIPPQIPPSHQLESLIEGRIELIEVLSSFLLP